MEVSDNGEDECECEWDRVRGKERGEARGEGLAVAKSWTERLANESGPAAIVGVDVVVGVELVLKIASRGVFRVVVVVGDKG